MPKVNDKSYYDKVIELSKKNESDLFKEFKSSNAGLKNSLVKSKIKEHGFNLIANEKPKSLIRRIFDDLKNPLNILLICLSIISYLTNDIKTAIIILLMVTLSMVLRIIQEVKASNAAEKLKSFISNKIIVIRNNHEVEVPIKEIVPGDILKLKVGDMIPADLIILNSKDLMINQSSLTGESLPTYKDNKINYSCKELFELSNVCFSGTNVIAGEMTGIVIFTGPKTYFGSLANSIIKNEHQTEFDKGINKFTWLMLKFIIIMVPLVFLINGISKNNWLEAFLFATAVAVGLTPEMLPMIVSVNLSKGAIAMSKKKAIVKRLDSIQSFGAMDILCTDKTGTITEGKTSLESHINVLGKIDNKVLEYAFLNSYYNTGLSNIMDETILEHGNKEKDFKYLKEFKKIDEIPFDFDRKRMSVITENNDLEQVLICKGAFEEIIAVCDHVDSDGKVSKLNEKNREEVKSIVDNLNENGYRVLAVAYKNINKKDAKSVYETEDEKALTLLGFLSFLDPPKKTSKEALADLQKLGIRIKILTGDNEKVTKHVCEEVGVNIHKIFHGLEIEKMTEEELIGAVNTADIFVKLAPNHKDRIIAALQKSGHVVGFMGDGINDASALKTADVGISVNSAAPIAKESSDIILLNNSLLILKDGVIEGRKVFGNIIKYIKMAASSNFGNMFSVVGASAFLPFLPMLPIQVLTNNLLYDFSQTTIPTDNVDKEWLEKPRKWTMDKIEKFVLIFGPISSIFDYLTFGILIYIFGGINNPVLFHTGWFIESVVTQTLIVHIIRTNKIPFIQSKPSKYLVISSVTVILVAVLLTITPISKVLGFTKLPLLYWLLLIILMTLYAFVTQIIKNVLIKKLNI